MTQSESVIERTARLFHIHYERLAMERHHKQVMLPWAMVPEEVKAHLRDTVAALLDDRACPLIPAIRA
jgi:hypothetical protein